MRFARAGYVIGVLCAATLGRANESNATSMTPWTSPDAPMFSPLTVPSGNVYTMLQAGAWQPSAGSRQIFAVFYVSNSYEESALFAAAQELLEVFRIAAERQRLDALGVIAYFDAAPGKSLKSLQAFAVRFDRRADGAWERAPVYGKPPAGNRLPRHGLPKSDRQAVATARSNLEAWILLLDGDRLEDAWSAACFSPMLSSKSVWVGQIEKVRATRGRVIRRRLLSSLERQHVPGMPDGPYIAFEFISTFDKRDGVLEQFAMTPCGDGRWRVAGYAVY